MFKNYDEAHKYFCDKVYNKAGLAKARYLNAEFVNDPRVRVLPNTYLHMYIVPELKVDVDVKFFYLKLHDTRIITYTPCRISYNTGGHKTKTTKTRMSMFSPYTVYSEKGEWGIMDYGNEILIPFVENCPLPDDGLGTYKP